MADEDKEGQEKPKKDMGKLFGLVFAGLNIVVLGAGAFMVYKSTLGYKPPVANEEELNKELVEFRKSLRTSPVIYEMSELTTNLDGIPRRLIRVEIGLEMLDEEGFEEVISKGAEPRDAIIRVLNSQKYLNLETVQGKLRLKNQIIAAVNESLRYGVVKNVYFSKFMIQ